MLFFTLLLRDSSFPYKASIWHVSGHLGWWLENLSMTPSYKTFQETVPIFATIHDIRDCSLFAQIHMYLSHCGRPTLPKRPRYSLQLMRRF